MGSETQFFFYIRPLLSGSVVSDPGSKNIADPTDPDPKHCIPLSTLFCTIKNYGVFHPQLYIHFIRRTNTKKIRVNLTWGGGKFILKRGTMFHENIHTCRNK